MTSFALIGDSQGVGLEPRLRELLPILFADPKVGWTTARIAGEPFERALASGASTILLVTGGNDSPLNVTSLREMVELTRRAGKKLIVVGPVFALTDDAARHDRARAQLQAATAGTSARFVDAYPMTRDLANAHNVHLTGANYRRYAERLSVAVRSTTGIGTVVAWGVGAYVLARLFAA